MPYETLAYAAGGDPVNFEAHDEALKNVHDERTMALPECCYMSSSTIDISIEDS
jgi:hypothetical protein